MKRFYHILFALAVSFMLDSCQEKIELETHIEIQVGEEEKPQEKEKEKEKGDDGPVEYEEILALSHAYSSGAQGGDCWGDYFFQFVAGNSRVRIFDLSQKKFVQSIIVPDSERGFIPECHCNTVCFGTEFYDADDRFPLIYVSTGYASGDGYTGALVYRITESNGKFSISLVQTLKFPFDTTSWTEFVPADDSAFLCYTSQRIIYKVKMPKLEEGDQIIDPKYSLGTYQFTPQPSWMSSSRNQDRLFYQGKIVYISGVPLGGQASVLVILNLENLEREKIYDFTKSGLTGESESIFVWKDNLCVAFSDRIVKLIL